MLKLFSLPNPSSFRPGAWRSVLSYCLALTLSSTALAAENRFDWPASKVVEQALIGTLSFGGEPLKLKNIKTSVWSPAGGILGDLESELTTDREDQRPS